jgi:hydrogenase nickel incorporation protein HypA/HybF
MHEFSMMEKILRVILLESKRHSAKGILEINLEVGELTFLNPDQLRFAFEVLSEGTVAERAKLNIEKVGARIKCPHCGYAGPISYEGPEDHLGYMPAFLECSICGSQELEVTSGR